MEHKGSEEIQRRMWVAQCLPCDPALLLILPLFTSAQGCWKGFAREI